MSILTLAATAAMAMLNPPATMAAPEVALWRLDCGTFVISDFRDFSDSHRYDGKPYTLTDSCYLIRHGDRYLLWDTGLTAELKGKTIVDGAYTLTLNMTIVEQLARIGVKPEQIEFVGISHYHADHTGQALAFPGATLLIGREDLNALKDGTSGETGAGLKPWLEGAAKTEAVRGDKDVFGDGSVTMVSLPGHTPGHHALLVRLKGRGPVLLSGDQFHATESLEKNEVPGFNFDRADTLASSDRFRAIAANLGATIIIQHEPRDVAKLPLFPEPAR